MAILAALIALGSRFATKILTTALGWATTLLFGRVPASRQIALLAITFGSVIWAVLVVGVIVPDVGTFLLLFVPSQDFVPELVIRAAMLIGALVVPGVVGFLILWLSPAADRREKAAIASVLRGYPVTALLAALLVFLAGLAIYRKAWSLARRWTDAHVPLVVEPGHYEDVARDLDDALSQAGLDVTPRPAPSVMSRPAQWLARVAGRESAALVPDHMVQLHGPDLDVLVYPMDLLISGQPSHVMRARAAMASRLTTSAAHLTVSAEAQGIEDRLTRLARGATSNGEPMFDDATADDLAAIDHLLATVEIPYDEWEVLYRQRLQVERDLRARAMARPATPTPVIEPVQRVLRQGAEAVADAATDDATIATLDRIAGPVWTTGVRLAAAALATALRSRREASDRPTHRATEPADAGTGPPAP
jgi:hypothetical protein